MTTLGLSNNSYLFPTEGLTSYTSLIFWKVYIPDGL